MNGSTMNTPELSKCLSWYLRLNLDDAAASDLAFAVLYMDPKEWEESADWKRIKTGTPRNHRSWPRWGRYRMFARNREQMKERVI